MDWGLARPCVGGDASAAFQAPALDSGQLGANPGKCPAFWCQTLPPPILANSAGHACRRLCFIGGHKVCRRSCLTLAAACVAV